MKREYRCLNPHCETDLFAPAKPVLPNAKAVCPGCSGTDTVRRITVHWIVPDKDGAIPTKIGQHRVACDTENKRKSWDVSWEALTPEPQAMNCDQCQAQWEATEATKESE